MQDPEPPKPPTSWVPHQSVVAGSTIGGAVAVLVLPFIIRFYPSGIDHDSITASFTVLCTAIACYLIPDGNRSQQ